jgi:hypothetical protein
VFVRFVRLVFLPRREFLLNNYPRLCGGTFFILILQARRQRSKARDRYQGGNDGLADTNVLTGLIRVAQPHYPTPSTSTFRHNTSEYKACQISHSSYLPFNDQTFKDGFDRQIKTDYSKAVESMSDFANKYIDRENTEKIKRLIKALLEVIEKDRSIADTDRFYWDSHKEAVTKAAILRMTDICLQPFLLAVWHYIVMNRQDNTIGRTTFEMWHKAPEVRGRPWNFISNVGNGIERLLHITIHGNIEEAFDKKSDADKAERYARNPDSTIPQTSSMDEGNIWTAPIDYTNTEVNFVTPGREYASGHTKTTRITLSTEFFNMFVVAGERFMGKGFLIPSNRVLRSYMIPEVANRFSDLSENAISQIKTLPSLFTDEYRDLPRQEEEQMAHFGIVTDLSSHENGMYIRFRRISAVPLKKIFDLSFKLGLYGNTSFHELFHTHWAIKKVDLVDILKAEGIDILTPT